MPRTANRNLTIRALRPGDRSTIASVLAGISTLREWMDRDRQLGLPWTMEDTATIFAQAKEGQTLVAYVGRTPVGFTFLEVIERDVVKAEMWIRDDWQESGVGTALREAIRPRLVKSGIRYVVGAIFGTADGTNHQALRLLGPNAYIERDDPGLVYVVDLRSKRKPTADEARRVLSGAELNAA